jgi:hypothetical protein
MFRHTTYLKGSLCFNFVLLPGDESCIRTHLYAESTFKYGSFLLLLHIQMLFVCFCFITLLFPCYDRCISVRNAGFFLSEYLPRQTSPALKCSDELFSTICSLFFYLFMVSLSVLIIVLMNIKLEGK